MTRQHLVRQPKPELTDSHKGFMQILTIKFDFYHPPVKLCHAFFTLNWKKRIMEIYTEHMGYHGLNMNSISKLELEAEDDLPKEWGPGMGKTIFSSKVGSPDVLRDDQWEKIYKMQPWTKDGTISIHKEVLPWLEQLDP